MHQASLKIKAQSKKYTSLYFTICSTYQRKKPSRAIKKHPIRLLYTCAYVRGGQTIKNWLQFCFLFLSFNIIIGLNPCTSWGSLLGSSFCALLRMLSNLWKLNTSTSSWNMNCYHTQWSYRELNKNVSTKGSRKKRFFS